MYWLILFFIVIPVIEIALFIWTGSMIGIWSVIMLIFLTGLAGIIFVRYEGIKTYQRVGELIQQGIRPDNEILNGICILLAGVCLITPGFLTDLIGFLLLIPFTRKPFKALIMYSLIKMMKRKSTIFIKRF
ncbi:MAG TPA: FxsA family protein [Pseudogracilibacillus sp.]|nr:FxsA family protein [Pseudogracilibacillus sp.]